MKLIRCPSKIIRLCSLELVHNYLFGRHIDIDISASSKYITHSTAMNSRRLNPKATILENPNNDSKIRCQICHKRLHIHCRLITSAGPCRTSL